MENTERTIAVTEVEAILERIYVAAEGATLRTEDRRKAAFLTAMLGEVRRAAARCTTREPLVLVDAAAGKSYLGLLAAELVLRDRDARVVTIEREPTRVARSREAAFRLAPPCDVDCVAGDVADPSCWPTAPGIVVALHACGEAADGVIDRAIASAARHLLLVPCCTSARVRGAGAAESAARALAIPRQAPVRRRFVQAIVDAERTLRLEAAGYETEVVEVVPPAISPHNLLYRARRVGLGERSRRAALDLQALLSVYK